MQALWDFEDCQGAAGACSLSSHRRTIVTPEHQDDMVSCHSARLLPPGGGNTGDMHDICSCTVHWHHYSVMFPTPLRVNTPWFMVYGSPESLEQRPATASRQWERPRDTGLLAMLVVSQMRGSWASSWHNDAQGTRADAPASFVILLHGQCSAVEPLHSQTDPASASHHITHGHWTTPPIPDTHHPRSQRQSTAYPRPRIAIANTNPVQGRTLPSLRNGTPTGVSLSSRRTAISRLQIQFLQTPLLHALLGSHARGLLKAGTGGGTTALLVHALVEHCHRHAGDGKGSLEDKGCHVAVGTRMGTRTYVRTKALDAFIAPEAG
ncbi:hypothetical protein HBI42_230470 [Parastagonospora nodorum]|nr:hypothetical protein HBI09_071720 [Parastagonospora nodorum]KAH4053818.1 hypothetical protein HBH49_088920 [Parastagonospora nodorum]KAH4976435.1 hypothetical protein HBI76_238900 [Parastagonospora nodorum]KAH5017653.1 hypothetical protein HBI77_057210 [Parastagonospora nodorum]KAH5521806.1 hypothetical protein HBI29_058060 [Parastagonospora nodorum]